MKRIKKILNTTSLTVCLAILTGCDSTTPLASDTRFTLDDFQNIERFNKTELENNRAATARMPSSLSSQDTITYSPFLEDFTINNVNLPRTRGEAPWVIRPNSAGTVVIEQRRYAYTSAITQNEAILEINAADQVSGPAFDSAMAQLAAAGEARPGSLSSLITTIKYPPFSAGIFRLTVEEREAIRQAVVSLGYIAVNMPDAVAIGRGSRDNQVQVDVDNIVVLTRRRFTHTVTSTNADILDSGQIRGTFEVEDTYYDLAVQAGVGDGFYRVIIARIPVFSDNLQVQSIRPFAQGIFTLNMESL